MRVARRIDGVVKGWNHRCNIVSSSRRVVSGGGDGDGNFKESDIDEGWLKDNMHTEVHNTRSTRHLFRTRTHKRRTSDHHRNNSHSTRKDLLYSHIHSSHHPRTDKYYNMGSGAALDRVDMPSVQYISVELRSPPDRLLSKVSNHGKFSTTIESTYAGNTRVHNMDMVCQCNRCRDVRSQGNTTTRATSLDNTFVAVKLEVWFDSTRTCGSRRAEVGITGWVSGDVERSIVPRRSIRNKLETTGASCRRPCLGIQNDKD